MNLLLYFQANCKPNFPEKKQIFNFLDIFFNVYSILRWQRNVTVMHQKSFAFLTFPLSSPFFTFLTIKINTRVFFGDCN